MIALCSRLLRGLWPRSLFARLTLTWMLSLLAGHLISAGNIAFHELRDERVGTGRYLAYDVSNLVKILERVPLNERPQWIQSFQRDSYQFALGNSSQINPKISSKNQRSLQAVSPLLQKLQQALGSAYTISSSATADEKFDISFHLQLHDGTPLMVQARIEKAGFTVGIVDGLIFLLQGLSLALITWIAVKQATHPLQQLALSADKLGTSLRCEPLSEDGPLEVARAAAAFNLMQKRIVDHMAERMQILAAISHDLQTPITRMRLRADLLESSEQRSKLHGDLDTMQVLVEEGIAYARSAHSSTEALCRVDLDALLESMVFDYSDADQDIQLEGHCGLALMTRPNALRRVLTNLIDNAFKYSDKVELRISSPNPQQISIAVLDRGPGIPEQELQAVLQPFYRVEASRNRDTGGTGLGLAIAYQLSLSLDGSLVLNNRVGGGLEARLTLPIMT